MIPRLQVSPLALRALPISSIRRVPSPALGRLGRNAARGVAAALVMMAAACAPAATPAPAATSGPAATPTMGAASTPATGASGAAATPSSTAQAAATREASPAAASTAGPAAAPTAPPGNGQPAVPTTGTAAATDGAAATTAARAPEATSSPVPPPATAAPQAPSRASSGRTAQSWADGPAELSSGQATGLQLSGEGARLAQGDGGYGSGGELLSKPHEADFPFNNAVLSWNAEAPAGSSLRFELRVRGDAGWSGWYAMGEWRPEGGRSISGQGDANGNVDVDTLKLTSTATALQYRVKLSSSSPIGSPLLRQLSVVYADMRKAPAGPPLERPAGAVRDLEVPRHSQLEQDPSVALKICSPTSLAMVLQYWGLKKTVPEVYAGVQDRTTGIYGDWPLNTAFAGANGFRARVDRFYAVEQLEQEIAAGRPAIISVAYSAGEITGAATTSTDGHLIVVRGFSPQGDVIVNDPVAPNSRSVRLVYSREQLSRVWLRSGGIVYLISPR